MVDLITMSQSRLLMGCEWLHQLSLSSLEALAGSLPFDCRRHEEDAMPCVLSGQLSSRSLHVAIVRASGAEIEVAGGIGFVACDVGVVECFEVALDFELRCKVEVVLEVELEPVRSQCYLTARSSKLRLGC